MDRNKTKLRRPLMVVVSAPSGAGKSTLCGRLLQEFPEFVYSVSCTTRAPRGTEIEGTAYFFLSEEQFCQRVTAGEFLEYAVVHGNHYGTLKRTVAEAMTAGRSVILDIDVDGAAQVRQIVAGLAEDDPMKMGFLDIFIGVPSLATLRGRLEKRGEDSAETIGKRVRNAEQEMARADEFTHRLVNDELERTYAAFRAIVAGAASRL